MPARASSSDSDFMDRMSSSSPEPPDDPLADVIIGSQSRAALRGEYVPVPTRSYGASTRVGQASTVRGPANAVLLQPPAPSRPVSRAKPPSSKAAAKPQSIAKPPSSRSQSRVASRPPVSKGKGKAREFNDVIVISDESDGEGPSVRPPAPTRARPTFPLHPSRRGNVAEPRASTTPAPTSTSAVVPAAPMVTASRKKRPGTDASRRTLARQDSAVRVESSEDEGDDAGAFVTADEGHDVGFGSGFGSRVPETAAKRRRIDKADEERRGQEGEEADAGAPMDVDVDVDMRVGLRADDDMEVDAGYQSCSTLSYVSEAPRERQLDTVREESVTPRREPAGDEEEEDERPFPDFDALRASSSTASGSANSAVLSGRHENAVAGPSNSNSHLGPLSTSGVAAAAAAARPSNPKPNTTSTMIENLKLHPNASLSDHVGMSPEDAAAVYAAMFGHADEAPSVVPAPVLRSVAPVGLDADGRVGVAVDDAGVGVGEGKGKGKARAEPQPQEDVFGPVMEPSAPPGLAQVQAPMLKWGDWDPLRAAGNSGEAQIRAKDRAPGLGRGPAPADDRYLLALRAATAPSGSKVQAGDRDATVPPHVAYMRDAARAFEEAWNIRLAEQGRETGKGKGKERSRQDDRPAAVAAAQNAFTFTFPRAAGAPAEPPVPRQLNEAQDQYVAAPPPDPWAFMFAPPKPREPEPAPQNAQHLHVPAPAPAPVPQAFAFGAVPVPAALPLVPLPVVAPEPPLAAGGPVPRPAAFTFVFPRGAGGPAALPHEQVQARVPGPIVVPQAQPRPQVQPQPPQIQPAQAPLPVAIPAPPVRAAAPPPPAPPAVPAPAPPASVAIPAPAPAPAHVPPPAPALSREQLTERAIAQITEILPDVEPGYLLAHVVTYVDTMKGRTAEHVLGLLFEAEAAGGYPRIVRERAPPVPVPVPVPAPAPVPQAQVPPRVPVRQPQPQPVAGGSNLGVRAQGVNLQGGAAQPRVEEPANEKQDADEVIDYTDVNRPAPSEAYRRLSILYLRLAFPYLPKYIVTTALAQHRNLYAPTYLNLQAAERRYTAFPVRDERPYRCNSTKYSAASERRALAHVWDELFGEEWLWVEDRQGRSLFLPRSYAHVRASHSALDDVAAMERALRRYVPARAHVPHPARVQDQPQAAIPPPHAAQEPQAPGAEIGKGKQRAVDVDMEPPMEEQPVEEEGDIECGCCFSEYTFDKMVQCPDAHLFCSDCVSQYAATQLGGHNPSLVCMHASDCKLPFPESELRRVLTPTLMALYSRLTAQRAVAAAGLEGLEECPFCDWQCVIEAPIEVDRLFRCGNAEGGCGVVSCRECKKKDHRPKTCKEMEEDQVLDGQHAIEEAMTRALMRNCPNPRCKKAFVKDTGCNKMTCPHCRTLSCYVCREIIKGYDHFDVMPGAAANTAVAGRCKLWENVEERHANEVRAAAERAAEDLRRANPELDHEAIKVDIPVAPPPAPAGAAHRAAPAPVVNPHQVHQQRAAQLRVERERLQRLADEEARRQMELRAEMEIHAEIMRQEREQQEKQQRREREAQELRRQEALRIRLQARQQELIRARNRAALVAQRDAERLAAMNPGPFGGPVRALPPPLHPLFPQGADQNNRGQREQ